MCLFMLCLYIELGELWNFVCVFCMEFVKCGFCGCLWLFMKVVMFYVF